MLTLATSFVNKPLVIQVWFECFKLLNVPKNETKLVWIDMTENKIISDLLQKYIKEHGNEWKEVVYLKNQTNDSAAKILNLINSHREGHLLLWEYDIIVPANAYLRLRSVFNENYCFAAVTGVEYYKEKGSNPRIMAWNFEKVLFERKREKNESFFVSLKNYIFYTFKYKGFPISFSLIKYIWEEKTLLLTRKNSLLTYKGIPVNLKIFNIWRDNTKIKSLLEENLPSESLSKLMFLKEKEYGVEEMSASGMGFVLYRDNFLHSHVFKSIDSYELSIEIGLNIQKINNKLMLCWDLKFPHIDEVDKKVTLYFSKMCKTKINGLSKYYPNYSGNKIFGIGLEKTGTVSLHKAFEDLGISSLHYYNMNKYNELIKTTGQQFPDDVYLYYQAFSDWPFFKIYKELDKQFPHSKFIWTQRDLNSWLMSVKNHSERVPNEWNKFDKEERVWEWNAHNKSIAEYFKDRPDDLLILNIINGEGWEKLCPFLEKEIPPYPFPDLNKSPKVL